MSALRTIARAPQTVGRAVAGRGSRLDRLLDRGRRRSIVTTVVAALLVAALAAGTWLFFQAHRERQIDAARTEGVRAASELTTQLLSYDYRNLDADLARANQGTTGDFTQQYDSLAGQLIKPSATQQQIVTSAQIIGSSVISATPDSVVTLLYINQTTTGKDQNTPRIDRSRAEVTMTLVNEKWLISDLSPV